MKMFKKKCEKLEFVVIWQVLVLIVAFLTSTAGECNVCQENRAACINSTSFYLCFGGSKPNTDTLYHCKDGLDCTDLTAICVQTSSQRPPSCGDTSQCGLCSAHRNFLFACHSRTTFQMCYGAKRPIGQIGYCPKGYVCHGNSDAICVPESSVDSVTCDILENGSGGVIQSSSTTSTTFKPTEDTTTENAGNGMLTPTEVCKQKLSVGLYPTIPNDQYCKRYVYCYYTNGILRGIEYNCSSGTYFHIQQQKCVFNKPSYCL